MVGRGGLFVEVLKLVQGVRYPEMYLSQVNPFM
ncbi:hypothetical protein M2405_004220 [Rhodococcus erythropolis]|nr:hypothetical protein [Rhodococcus erythropolis]MCW2425434.1 hypothetical protein [Rhodococcus erythropolis]